MFMVLSCFKFSILSGSRFYTVTGTAVTSAGFDMGIGSELVSCRFRLRVYMSARTDVSA